MAVKIEDIIFWILITAVIAIAIWKLFGSPTDTATIISIALYITVSELIIWKKIFSMEKNISISFIKMKNDIDNKHSELINLIKKKR